MREKKILRQELLNEMAEYIVRRTMGEATKNGLKRCDFCEGVPPEGELCKNSTDCLEYGFEELHSMNSAKREIAKILAGRI